MPPSGLQFCVPDSSHTFVISFEAWHENLSLHTLQDQYFCILEMSPNNELPPTIAQTFVRKCKNGVLRFVNCTWINRGRFRGIWCWHSVIGAIVISLCGIRTPGSGSLPRKAKQSCLATEQMCWGDEDENWLTPIPGQINCGPLNS